MAARMFATALFFACALHMAEVHGCIYKFGEAPGHELSPPSNNHFTYRFAGLDWSGMCSTGVKQSPINIPVKNATSFKTIPASARTMMDFGVATSNGSNIKIFNNGHVIQVEWADPAWAPNASVALPNLTTAVLTDTLTSTNRTKRAKITPLQFHFHTHSEHTMGGAMYPLEGHIVSRAVVEDLPGCTTAPGCLTVVGIMFALSDTNTDNDFLNDIFDNMPDMEGGVSYLPKGKTLNITSMLPSNKSYITYEGSLTTPPCSESVLWHVMLTPQYLSMHQLELFMTATGDIECPDTAQTNSSTLTANAIEESDGCHKLGAGQNYRVVQPIRDRVISAYIQQPKKTNIHESAGTSLGVSHALFLALATICFTLL